MSSTTNVVKEQSAVLKAVKKFLADFGLPRIIILAAFVLLFVLAGIYGMDLPSFFGDVLRRWGMFGILVLAMVPGIQSGIGPNFGVTVGIVGGLVGAVLSIEMNHLNVFDFITNPSLHAVVLALVAMVIGVILATGMGILYGMLLNRVKGSEMAVSVYVGFSAVAVFNILWARMPVTASIMILPATGQGLRQMINLRDDFGGAFDRLLRFTIGGDTATPPDLHPDFAGVDLEGLIEPSVYGGGMFAYDFLPSTQTLGMTVHTGLLLVFFFFCFLMWIFTRSRLGMMMSAAGSNPSYARASGINVDKMRIIGTAMSTALGAVGIIVYAQSFGFLQMYNAPLMMGFTAVASVLIGGATVRRARVFDVLLGAFLFNGILTIALPLVNRMLPEVAGVPEMLRLIITNGIILYALTRAKGGR